MGKTRDLFKKSVDTKGILYAKMGTIKDRNSKDQREILRWATLCLWRAKSLQSCLTLCKPIDCSPPGSSVHAILQAGTRPCSPPGESNPSRESGT